MATAKRQLVRATGVIAGTRVRARRLASPTNSRLTRMARASLPRASNGPPSLLIGPANYAGQAHLLGQALNREAGQDLAVSLDTTAVFSGDHYLSAGDLRFEDGVSWLSSLLNGVTHVLLDGGLGLWGNESMSFGPTARVLKDLGYRVGYLGHGSDIRRPSQLMKATNNSPYAIASSRLAIAFEGQTTVNLRDIARGGYQAFYSTPDLAAFLPPTAIHLPQVVRPFRLETKPPPTELSGRVPRVLFAPMQGWWKGASVVDPVLWGLHDRGIIHYDRLGDPGGHGGRSLGVVNQLELSDRIRQADVVIDQVLISSYGLTAIEALHQGKVVVGRIGDHYRNLGVSPPILGVDPASFERDFHFLLEHLDDLLQSSWVEGPAFVEQHHDGRAAARALLRWLEC